MMIVNANAIAIVICKLITTFFASRPLIHAHFNHDETTNSIASFARLAFARCSNFSANDDDNFGRSRKIFKRR